MIAERNAVGGGAVAKRRLRGGRPAPDSEVKDSWHREDDIVVALLLLDFEAERITIKGDGGRHVFDDFRDAGEMTDHISSLRRGLSGVADCRYLRNAGGRWTV